LRGLLLTEARRDGDGRVGEGGTHYKGGEKGEIEDRKRGGRRRKGKLEEGERGGGVQ